MARTDRKMRDAKRCSMKIPEDEVEEGGLGFDWDRPPVSGINQPTSTEDLAHYIKLQLERSNVIKSCSLLCKGFIMAAPAHVSML